MNRIRTAVLVTTAALVACAAEPTDESSGSSLSQEIALSEPVAVQTEQTAPRGGASTTEIVYDDPELKCYRFTAYQATDRRGDKYAVPSRPDLYVGFNIKAPWTGTQYIKSLRGIIDNKQVVHHWILYRHLNGGTESVLEDVTGLHPDGEMLYGWGPGSSDLWFHPDVGMEIPAGSVFQLEMHYNNASGAPVPDASGAEICITPKKPEHVAAVSFLGDLRVNGTTATGHCTHESKEPVHLILGLPHMHKMGRHMKIDLTHAGTVSTIHDLPYDFNYQYSYRFNEVIQPGDKLTINCSYGAPARFGPKTSDEMCYFFAVHWPAGALSRRSLFNTVHGRNTCIDD